MDHTLLANTSIQNYTSLFNDNVGISGNFGKMMVNPRIKDSNPNKGLELAPIPQYLADWKINFETDNENDGSRMIAALHGK